MGKVGSDDITTRIIKFLGKLVKERLKEIVNEIMKDKTIPHGNNHTDTQEEARERNNYRRRT